MLHDLCAIELNLMLRTISSVLIFTRLNGLTSAQEFDPSSQPAQPADDPQNQTFAGQWINPFQSLPRTRQFSITCCRDSSPEPDAAVRPYLLEWSVEDLGNVSYDASCRRFSGHVTVPSGIFAQLEKNLEIRCNCSDDPKLDRNCRYLPPCENAGYRSFSINLRCVCPPKWFGELCESYCLNGELVKDENNIDECYCDQNFYGVACDKIACFHQGTPAYGNRACQCPYGYGGRFCELRNDGFRNGNGSFLDTEAEPQQSYFVRDIAATAVSLCLIVALCLGVYVVVRRRTNRIRNDLRQLQSAIVDVQNNNERLASAPQLHRFQAASAMSMHGSLPPSYASSAAIDSLAAVVPGTGGTRVLPDDLQPPPSYDDLFKDGVELQELSSSNNSLATASNNEHQQQPLEETSSSNNTTNRE